MIAYLLDSLFIALLKSQDLTSSLLGVVDLLPRLHLLLLQKGDTVGKELSISLDTSTKESVRNTLKLHRQLFD